jgi:hypothetical protein
VSSFPPQLILELGSARFGCPCTALRLVGLALRFVGLTLRLDGSLLRRSPSTSSASGCSRP